MREIMKVFDVHPIPNRGVVIGGTNPLLDHWSRQTIQAWIGKEVEIHTTKTVLPAKVIDVTVASSLTGHKNIFILLPQEVKLGDIQEPAVVYGVH
jgi:hypothetical protein